MLTFGTGIGSGLFLDGRLVPNTELGHLEIDGQDAETRAAASARDREHLSWENWAERVERYLRQVVFLFSPELIIVGGGASRKADKWVPLHRRRRRDRARRPHQRGRHRGRRARRRPGVAPPVPARARRARDRVEGRETHVAGGVPLRENGSVPERSPSRWRALGALLRPDALRWALLGALIAASTAGAIAGPLVVREVVDAATEGTTAGEIARLGLLFLAIAVVTQVIGVIVVRRATKLAWGITNELRLDITRHVLGLDHEFHRRHTPGELIQRVDGDVTNVSDFLSQVVPKVFGAIMLVTRRARRARSCSTGASGWAWSSTSASASPLLVSLRHRAVSESSDEMGAYARLYGGIEERLTAIEDLRSNGAEVHAMWRFVEDSSAALDSSVRRERAFLRMWWAVSLSVTVGSVLRSRCRRCSSSAA